LNWQRRMDRKGRGGRRENLVPHFAAQSYVPGKLLFSVKPRFIPSNEDPTAIVMH
jgi:hypothetical protein